MDIVKSAIYKTTLSAFTLCLLLAISSIAEAQNFQVSGKVVTANNQKPLPGVSILEVGTGNGTVTDSNGHFSLTVANGNASLRFSFIGYKTKVVKVNDRSTITVKLQSSVENMNQLVVTALGIKRHSNSLSYSTQSIPSKELTKVQTPNFINSLQGKSAGVLITKGTSGPGSSSRITIRGQRSLTGNSAPLYVINGIPISQGTGGAGTDVGNLSFAGASSIGFFNHEDTGGPMSFINPQNIQNIQILKGASASALYGSQAANGVILITTKKGMPGKTNVNLYSTTTFQSVMHTPKTQTEYGRTVKTANDSWGEKISDGDNSFIRDYFDTGLTLINGASVSGGNDMLQFFGSFSNTNQKGVLPTNAVIKDNIYFSASGQFLENKRLHAHASVKYIKKHLKNPARSGFYFSQMLALYTFPPSDDFSKYDTEGSKTFKKWNPKRKIYLQHWPYIRNEASTDQNPYWIAYRDPQGFFTNKTLMQFKASYDLTKWLSVQARTTLNLNKGRHFTKQYAGTDAVDAGSAGSKSGNYATGTTNGRSLYSDFLFNASGDVSPTVSMDGTLGYVIQTGHSYGLNMHSAGSAGLIYPNVFTVANFVSPASVEGVPQFSYGENEYKSFSEALFGTLNIGYKNTVYLNLTGRNEWSYTSPNSFFYPSVGLSYVITNTTGTSDFLSYAKVRASWAQVGSPLPRGVNDRIPPYTINTSTGSVNVGRTLPFFSGSDTTNLVPERTNSFEAGFTLGLLQNKLQVEFTYYDATTKNQIFTIAAPVGSGAANFYINGGSVRNFGVGTVISYATDIGNSVHWNTSLNFSHNVNQIRNLSDLLPTDRFQISSSNATRLVASFAYRPGKGQGGYYGSLGDYYGQVIKRNSDGSVVTDKDGLPVLTSVGSSFVGNPNPHYLAGLNNTFSYKGFNFSFLISGRFGGYVYSLTRAWLDFKGLTKKTARARDRGYAMLYGQKFKFTKDLTAHDFFNRISGGGNYPAVLQYRYSATNVRLRQVSIGYNFSHVGNFIDGIDISLTSRNLFFFYKDAPYDPEKLAGSASGYSGLSVFGVPATRSYGFSVNIKI